MVGIFGEKVSLGQANGPDVELIVRGTEFYATYETPDGFPAIYDDELGLFCYARIVEGSFTTTGVPVTSPPTDEVKRHSTETDEVRMRKIEERTQKMGRRSRLPPTEE
ncbi:hypothetical protein [Pararhizobium sp. DWP3-4]|uniref:hypothetical protein n=1 Tax=unclassified Pararhizobium TaxID=2643050 RepID=UPI003CEACF4A